MIRQSTESWSREDLQKLLILAGQSTSLTKAVWAKIGAELGRSAMSCKGKYYWAITRTAREERKAAAAPTVRSWRARDVAMEAAREARDTAPAPQSLTAWFCGDPLPGRSALDQKLAQPAQPAITLPTAGFSL